MICGTIFELSASESEAQKVGRTVEPNANSNVEVDKHYDGFCAETAYVTIKAQCYLGDRGLS